MSSKLTFKGFLLMLEQDIHKKIAYIAQDLVGSPLIKTDSIKETDIENAREEKHRFVDSAAGPWIISIFRAGWGKFVRIDPPKGADQFKQEYYVPVEK